MQLRTTPTTCPPEVNRPRRSRERAHRTAVTSGLSRTRNLPCALVLLALFSNAAVADLRNDINAVRVRGCENQPGIQRSLLASRDLNEVAREWSRGGRLRDALARSPYRATNSSSMHIEGATDDRSVLRVLVDHYCEILVDPTFTEMGTYRRGKNIWLVVAAPFSAPAIKDAPAMQRDVLTLVNKARAKPRRCGNKSFSAVPPLTLSATLSRAALAHAQDMAAHDHFEHTGTDGSTPAQRATLAGYQWRNVAENIAAGPTTADVLVDGWLNSPGHCANIMGAQYTEMGVGFAVNGKSKSGIYWAQEFGRQKTE